MCSLPRPWSLPALPSAGEGTAEIGDGEAGHVLGQAERLDAGIVAGGSRLMLAISTPRFIY
jgi:hypothetical protein